MFIQDVIARPIKHSDGTLDLSVWECIIPDKNKVKCETFIEILNLKFSQILIKIFYLLKLKLLY